jgi:hypothetical protein
VRLKFIDFEGSADEWRAAGLQSVLSPGSNLVIEGENVEESDGTSSPTVREQLANDEAFLRQVLAQHPLSPAQDTLLRLLLAADPVRMVPRSEMGAALGYTQSQLDGVLGWLGRRVNATPRADMNTAADTGVLFEWERANGDGEWCYRLLPTFRRVLEDFYSDR